MTFSDGGHFEGGRVRTGGGSRGVAIGGGIGGIVLVAIAVLLQGGGAGDVLRAITGSGSQGQTAGVIGECSASDANTSRDCRLSATVQALDAYWAGELSAQEVPFQAPGVTSFDSAIDSGCGAATSQTGPFYCPADQSIYIDLTFYDLLSSQFGAEDGPLAEEYVTAHEYGHHIQYLMGTMNQVDRSGSGPDSDAVRLELQADCYAGMWAGHAATTADPDTGVTFLEPITDAELANALLAAQSVGDDHIQEAANGSITPDTWTHGSSVQRQSWFMTGYQEGTLQACNTFTGDHL